MLWPPGWAIPTALMRLQGQPLVTPRLEARLRQVALEVPVNANEPVDELWRPAESEVKARPESYRHTDSTLNSPASPRAAPESALEQDSPHASLRDSVESPAGLSATRWRHIQWGLAQQVLLEFVSVSLPDPPQGTPQQWVFRLCWCEHRRGGESDWGWQVQLVSGPYDPLGRWLLQRLQSGLQGQPALERAEEQAWLLPVSRQ